MSFTFDVKQEILAQDFTPENGIAFISGLLACSSRPKSHPIAKLNNAELATVVRDFLGQLGIKYEQSSENKNYIVVPSFEQPDNIKFPAYYFAGAFLGGGSLSDVNSSSYHLEIQIYSRSTAELMQKFLNKYTFKFMLIQRRKL